MIPLPTLASFFAIALLLSLTPGPDNIFVMLQSAMRGPKIGMLIVLGLCSGLLLHTAAVALGLAAIFATSAFAFTVLKVVGAAYLVYLAWQAMTAPRAINNQINRNSFSLFDAYLRGLIMNISNPKIIVFFLALLPQFVHDENGSVTIQLLMLGGVFIIATLIVFSTIAYFSSVFGALLTRFERSNIILNRMAGAVFLGLAIKLLFTQR